MTDITAALNTIQTEETQFRASLSENMFQRVGAVTNQLTGKYFLNHEFNLNGSYGLAVGLDGADGSFSLPFDFEITAFYYRIGAVGTGGTSTIDLHEFSAAGADAGTIFSTKASVDTSAADNSMTMFDVINSNTISNPTGHTLAVLSKTAFTAGEQIMVQVDEAMGGARDFNFVLFYRPT